VTIVNELQLKGVILGFEEYEEYVLRPSFGEASPFRLLECGQAAISFVVVNPYFIEEDYSFEIDDTLLKELFCEGNCSEEIAVLCLVRSDEKTLYVNLRSPLVVNTGNGVFAQTILQNEQYPVSVPFAMKKGK
jgi:flagellar assembly factor FliW